MDSVKETHLCVCGRKLAGPRPHRHGPAASEVVLRLDAIARERAELVSTMVGKPGQRKHLTRLRALAKEADTLRGELAHLTHSEA